MLGESVGFPLEPGSIRHLFQVLAQNLEMGGGLLSFFVLGIAGHHTRGKLGELRPDFVQLLWPFYAWRRRSTFFRTRGLTF